MPKDPTPDNIAAHIKANAGTRYPCYKLANAFDCEVEDMREMLMKLADAGRIEMVVVSRQRQFFVRTESEQRLIDAMNAPPVAMKPYRPDGLAWQTVARRLAEFRAIPSMYPKLEKICVSEFGMMDRLRISDGIMRHGDGMKTFGVGGTVYAGLALPYHLTALMTR